MLADINASIIACRTCPRLVEYRENVAAEKRRMFRAETYWGRPLPGFGDPAARLFIIGLAPAAHGGNRTGRVFTGDASGDFLFAALHRAGLANQPDSRRIDDGLTLRGVYIAAACRCAPPDNKPTPDEFARCRPFLQAELEALTGARTLLALGKLAWDEALKATGVWDRRPRPAFGHSATADLGRWRLLGSYHPSHRNTATGLLTAGMMDAVLRVALGGGTADG